MCGIVGYIGKQEAQEILLEGLKKLEYRGYDSAGIAVLEQGELVVSKTVGKLANLQAVLEKSPIKGTVGIGHTRWATHGRPSDENSHPHPDCKGELAVVHNGIIENYIQLKEWLQGEGHNFLSETDTEVIPHLLEHFYAGDLEETVQKVITKLEGSFAFVVIAKDAPQKLIAARKDSPLVIGLGEGEYFIASDIPAILKYTRKSYILNDGELAILTPEAVRVTDNLGNTIEKEVFEVNWDAVAAEKDGYDHFMLKEIYEQPRAMRETMSARLSSDNKKVVLEEVKLTAADVAKIKKIYIVACGTAYHAGMVGKYVIEKIAKIPVEVDIASEFRYRDPLLDDEDLVIVVSQSGETADTLAALREAKSKGARVIAVTNVVGSSVAREADDVLYTWAGPEIAVASTKAYTTQLIGMYLIGLNLAQLKEVITEAEAQEIISAMRQLPNKAETVLGNIEKIKELIQPYSKVEDVFFLGRGIDYAVALEGSLKLKEISYIHAEAYAAGELKHGTLALIEEGILVVALATQMSIFDKMVSNIKEVKARDASVLGLTFRGNNELIKTVDEVIYIPTTHELLAPVLTVIPLQILSYYIAVARGCDVDKPRNLAKSVTVE